MEKSKNSERKLDHFLIFNTLFTKEPVNDEDIKSLFKPFIANRQLMNIPDLVFLLNNFNSKETNLNPLQYYKMLYYSIPKMKPPYLKFNNTQKKSDEYIKMLAEYYNCSYRIASEYIKFVYMNDKLREEIEYNHHLKNGTLKEFFDSVNNSKQKGRKVKNI